MTKRTTLYHPSSSGGGFKQWSIWIEKDGTTVTVEWGKVGHTLQTSSDPTKPKGKPGTKSYMDERACALFNVDRQVRKKTEEGYTPTMVESEDRERADLFDGLDKQFVPAKPRNDVTDEALSDLDFQGKLWIQRKRDGQRHIVLITRTGQVKIYSRRLDDMTEHFPLLCARIRSIGLPRRTILDGEVIIEQDGRDNFRAVGTITRSKPEKATPREAVYMRAGELRFMVFDVLYAAGQPIWKQPYAVRYAWMQDQLGEDQKGIIFVAYVYSALRDSLTKMMSYARRSGWEGLVCWLHSEPTVVRDGGKPKRAGCIKWKVKVDTDVVATGYFLGSGEKSKVVGGFDIAEYDENGTLVSCGKCGSGLDAETSADALTWEYPLVIAIQSDGQEEDSRKFRFPVYMKRHEDKVPEDLRS